MRGTNNVANFYSVRILHVGCCFEPRRKRTSLLSEHGPDLPFLLAIEDFRSH